MTNLGAIFFPGLTMHRRKIKKLDTPNWFDFTFKFLILICVLSANLQRKKLSIGELVDLSPLFLLIC
jgi:hypothetical protein